ncbi:hypothetical protein P4670_09970 [Neobacillus cucumis]|nr:hypothetical protein [Neobacillus cucumis]
MRRFKLVSNFVRRKKSPSKQTAATVIKTPTNMHCLKFSLNSLLKVEKTGGSFLLTHSLTIPNIADKAGNIVTMGIQ